MRQSDPQARAEDQLDRLEERSDALGEQIDDVRHDWAAGKHDPGVPSAAGDPDPAEGWLSPTLAKVAPGA